MPPVSPTTTVRPSSRTLGVRPGDHGERGERAGERERQAQRRPTRCGARDARRGLVAAGGRSEQPSGSAATAALPWIVLRSRHDYPDSLLARPLREDEVDERVHRAEGAPPDLLVGDRDVEAVLYQHNQLERVDRVEAERLAEDGRVVGDVAR